MNSPSQSSDSTVAPRPVPWWTWVVITALLALAAALPQFMALRYLASLLLLALGFYRRSTAFWIAVMMILGIIIGSDFRTLGPLWGAPDTVLQVPSKIFIKLVKTVVAPLLFSTLVIGISSHADIKTVGRLGLKSILYFEVVTTVALFVGLAAINWSQAGVGMTPDHFQGGEKLQVAHQQGVIDIILHTFPDNIAKSVAEGEVLQVVIFSMIFGVAMAMLSEEKRRPLLHVIESLAETMFKFTGIIMKLAPLAVGSAMAYTVAHLGLDSLQNLLKLVATLYLSLLVFLLFVLLPIVLLARIPLVPFLRAVSEPASIAFATSTSEAALPRAMERLEQLGVPRHVVSFVMPLGYSFNLDGTTLYLALAAVFVSQAANQPMPLATQLAMVASLMLSSKGVAGVPRASLVILLGTVAAFELPEWPVVAILGIDGVMDMARTAVNVTGNCLASCVVSRWENNFKPNYEHPFYAGYPKPLNAEVS